MIIRPGSYGLHAFGDTVLIVRERDRWHLPGGGWEAGESPVDALRREVREETGLTVTWEQPLLLDGFPRAEVMRTRDLGLIEKRYYFYEMDVSNEMPSWQASYVPWFDATYYLCQPAEREAVRHLFTREPA